MDANGHNNINTGQRDTLYTDVHVKHQNSSSKPLRLLHTTVQVVTSFVSVFITRRNKISAVYVYVKRK